MSTVDLVDQRAALAKTYGATESGTVLVCPDFFVAWWPVGDRCADDPAAALRALPHRR